MFVTPTGMQWKPLNVVVADNVTNVIRLIQSYKYQIPLSYLNANV